MAKANKSGHIQIGVQMPKAMSKQLSLAAVDLETDRSAVIRQALSEFLKRRRLEQEKSKSG